MLAFELHGRMLETPPAGGQLSGHAVEGFDERAELVLRLGHDAMVEVACTDLLRGGREQTNRPCDALGEVETHPR